jgi:hypothetical protein
VSNIAQTLGYVLGVIFIAGLLYLCNQLGGNFVLNYLAFITGAALGFVIGILASPKWEGQREAFEQYGKAIATFVSGFLLAKFEEPLRTAFGGSGPEAEVLLGRFAIFASAFLIGALFSWKARESDMRVWAQHLASQKPIPRKP